MQWQGMPPKSSSALQCLTWQRGAISAVQMGKLADFVGGQGKKGGKRWRLVFTAGAAISYLMCIRLPECCITDAYACMSAEQALRLT